MTHSDDTLNSVLVNSVNDDDCSDPICTYSVPLLKNFVHADLFGQNINILLDTGADVCVADTRIIEKYNLKNNGCECTASDRNNLNTADNSLMTVNAMIKVPLSINGHKTTAKFYLVHNLHVDFILGVDWLKDNDVQICFRTNKMHVNKRKLLFTTSDISIPAYSEHIIVARVRGDDLPRGTTGVSSGLQCSNNGLLIGKSLDTIHDNSVHVRCLNASNQPIKIKRNERIGQFKCLTSSDHLTIVDNENKSNTDQVEFRPSTQVGITDSEEITSYDKQALCNLIDRYADVFVGPDGMLGKCDVIKHKIVVTDNTPVRRRAYRLNPTQQKIMEAKLGELLQQGIIEESCSPWSAPCLLISKRNNTEHRLVTDFRALNAKTVLIANPLPTTQEALENIGMTKPKWFSVMDLQSGFFQAELDPSSKQYTAFATHVGLFQYCRLPQGLSNSAQTFQQIMEAVLRGLTWRSCAVYIDDIIVFEGQTFNEHLQAIEKVFIRLRKANLKLRANKCQFAQRKIKFLGHIISADGVQTDPDKIAAVKTYPAPKNVKQLKSFIGLANYYRKFCKNFSKIAMPLNALFKKDVPFVWSHECQQAFETLKHTLITAPMLRYPDLNLPFKLYTDASTISLGACLTQEINGTEYVVAYAGRSLSNAERKMGITMLECLGLVFGVKHFDFFLRNNHFTAVVDHQALLWLLKQKEPIGKFARWVSFLQQYSYDIKHRPGLQHCNADALSRREYTQTPEPNELIGLAAMLTADEPNDAGQPQPANTTDDLHIRPTEIAQPLLDMSQVIELQRDDDAYKAVIDYLERDILPLNQARARTVLIESAMFALIDGALHHVFVREGKGTKQQRTILQLAIPRPLIQTVLANMHDSPVSGGHYGISRTIEKVREKFYFPKMCAEIVKYVKSCITCCQRKRPAQQTNAAITPMPVPDAPWVRVSTDLLGRLPKCRDTGNQYVLVFIDYFTKYVELIAIPDAKAETVARALLERVILLHGAPQYLHSDRGTQYLSKLVSETCKLFNIHKTQTTSFHPACNGQSERMMTNILNSLAKLLEDKHDVWDKYIPFVQYSYNITPSLDSTGYSPYFLNHGRYPRMPIDTVLHVTSDALPSVKEFIKTVVDELQTAHSATEQILNERKEVMRKKSEQITNDPDFKVGDIVYIYEPVIVKGNSAKLARPFAGPYYIVEKPSHLHAKLRRVSDGKPIKNKVHINRLKRGLLRSTEPIDLHPPQNVDASEPAVLCYDEIDANNFMTNDNSSITRNNDDTVNVTDATADGAAVSATANDLTDRTQPICTAANKQKRAKKASNTDVTAHADSQQTFTVEKILRKKYANNTWQYRIKWLSFPNDQNSWVKFDDLSVELQQFVTSTHNKIPTDRKSQKKR